MALVLAGLLCAGVVAAVLLRSSGPSAQGRPNIVVIIDDDQTAEQQRFLAQTNAEIAGQGVTFDNSFVSYSLCCPSRTTLLTGQYAHNHRVLGDAPPSGGFDKLRPTLGNTLPVWLQHAGYYTGLVGKLLNHYGRTDPTFVPPGWNQWYGTVDNHSVGGNYTDYGYTLNQNGRLVHYGTHPSVVVPHLFQSDVLSRLATSFIHGRAGSGQPFFLYIAPHDPHFESRSCKCGLHNPRPPPGHANALGHVTAPQAPDFNEADVSDKPSEIRRLPSLTPGEITAINLRYRSEARSLLGVDDLVASVVRSLRATGQLDNTVIIFTSDNGFIDGQHRISKGKVLPYEPSIRVPLLIRAPGLPQGVQRQQPVVNADLSPTILDFAHATPGRVQDGQSLVPIMRSAGDWPGRGIALEAWANPMTPAQANDPPLVFRGVRTDRYMYARYGDGEQELYDLRSDPFELRNVAADPAYTGARMSLRRLLGVLASCAGTTCRTPPALVLRVHGCSNALVTGPGDAQSATFYLDGRQIGTDPRPPIGIRLPHGANGDRLEALAMSMDGRRVSLSTTLAGCG